MSLSGSEALHGPGAPTGTALDFWRWAYPDILTNSTRGVFAEWLVAQILNIPLLPRVEWDVCDLRTPCGVRIEVKSGARRQSWHTPSHAPSKVVFSGLRALPGTAEVRSGKEQTYNADLYVFAVHTEIDLQRWDAFDMAQWKFFILPNAALSALGQSSMGLSTLERLASAMDAVAFREYARRLISGFRADRG